MSWSEQADTLMKALTEAQMEMWKLVRPDTDRARFPQSGFC